MEPIETKIISELTIEELNSRANRLISDGYRPVGGPFPYGRLVAWAFFKSQPPAPKPEQPPPTKEELIQAAVEGRTIVREG